MYAALLSEVDGVRLISPERLREVSAVAFSGIDQIVGNPVSWALGCTLGRPAADPQEATTAFGFWGAGGSNAYADTATGISFALTKNRLSSDFGVAERVSEIVTKVLTES